jgi:aspartyl-tRNA(Asn)/glutamyl-tRNA(Gln) amidotransferase subunit A
MSLAGIPAISIPNGLAEGLPTGFQIAGPAFSENAILNAAHALEGAIGFDGSTALSRGGMPSTPSERGAGRPAGL